MKKTFKRIGVLTSGGDAPGMNAAVRAVTRSALAKNVEVLGIYEGYNGLIHPTERIKQFDSRDVGNIIHLGGTCLYSDRCDEFKTMEGMLKAVQTCKDYGIEGIITVGGDGTFRGARDLCELGIPCIGIPATIDNDISSTDYSIGFDTAMNTVVDMVDRLRDTCQSHARCNVVEVMGRDAGYIALEAGLAVGAIGIGVKEIPFDVDNMITKMFQYRKEGKRNFIIIVAEGLGSGYSEELVNTVQSRTGIETKFARLAHVQRGGSPTLRDRNVASLMGTKAVDLLLDGQQNLVVCIKDGLITEYDINFALFYDKLYKNRLKPEDRTKISDEDFALMEKMMETKRKRFKEIYESAKLLSM